MGRVYIVGIGPGNKDNMTFKAYDTMKKVNLIVGYKTYIDLVSVYFSKEKLISFPMMKEIDRCKEVLKYAKEGKDVALISSGDAGVYGMAGIMLELADKEVEVEVIPGITASNVASSIVGAPIMHDSCTISLSNLLTEWSLIEKRLKFASQADFVISLYNPKSKKRTKNIEIARDIMRKYKKGDTPVAIVKNAKRKDEEYYITDLDNMLSYEIDMLTTVIIGNKDTYIKNNKIITPRGYENKYEMI